MSKEDIEKLDKQIELLKKDNSGKPTGDVETVVTEIHDPNDENHVVNISYIDSEVKETTKELKDLKTVTTGVESTNVEVSDDTKKIAVTKNLDAIEEPLVEDNSLVKEVNQEPKQLKPELEKKVTTSKQNIEKKDTGSSKYKPKISMKEVTFLRDDVGLKIKNIDVEQVN